MLLKPSPHRAASISVELSFKADDQIRKKDSARITTSQVGVDSAKQPPPKQERSGAAPKRKSHVCCVPNRLFGSWSLLQGRGGKGEGQEVATILSELRSLLQGSVFMKSLV